MRESKYEHIVHPFPPLYNSESRILILGSLPSVKQNNTDGSSEWQTLTKFSNMP